MKLCEILKTSTFTYPYHQIANSKRMHMATYEFYAGDSEVVLHFSVIPSWSHPIYQKYFTEQTGEASMRGMDNVELLKTMEKIGGSYTIDFTVDESHEVTGGGNTIPIFATAIKIIKEFVSKHKTLELVYTADEKSRIKFYNRLTRELTVGTNFVRVGQALGIYNLIDKKLVNEVPNNA